MRRLVVGCVLTWAMCVWTLAVAIYERQWLLIPCALTAAICAAGWLLAARQWQLWRGVAEGLAGVLAGHTYDPNDE